MSHTAEITLVTDGLAAMVAKSGNCIIGSLREIYEHLRLDANLRNMSRQQLQKHLRTIENYPRGRCRVRVNKQGANTYLVYATDCDPSDELVRSGRAAPQVLFVDA